VGDSKGEHMSIKRINEVLSEVKTYFETLDLDNKLENLKTKTKPKIKKETQAIADLIMGNKIRSNMAYNDLENPTKENTSHIDYIKKTAEACIEKIIAFRSKNL